MKRRTFLCGLTAASTMVVAAGAAFADSFADAVVAQLTQQGFSNIGVETTWLGRMRIVASRNDGQREIILNPRTGEILRDTWIAAAGGKPKPIIDDIDDRSSSNEDHSGSDGSGSDGSGSDGGSDNSGSDGSGSGSSGSDGSGGSGGSGGGSGSDDSGGTDDSGGSGSGGTSGGGGGGGGGKDDGGKDDHGKGK